MSVEIVTKTTATSPKSFEDAILVGLKRANKTIRNITALHILDQRASVSGGKIKEFMVTMEVAFILENKT